MTKLQSFNELLELAGQFKSKTELRHSKDVGEILGAYKQNISVCSSTGCVASDSAAVYDALCAAIKKRGLDGEVQTIKTGCFGFCEQGPIVKIFPDNTFYVQVKPEDADELVQEHIVNKKPLERLLFKNPQTGERSREHTQIPFYNSQVRVALRNCGLIDPEDIEDYISVRGYEALGECVANKTQDDVIKTVKDSGLRGRGGAGFPTGAKWEFAKGARGSKKYVVCNADEGDPGAFMDRSILEGDPHSVIEAMAICGYAIGADEGVIYIRAEYPLAVRRLEIAIAQAEERGLMGNNILGTGFNFNISLSLGAGAFVCGEETALLNSVEGGRGEPRVKPPFPAIRGLNQKPTNINNVETFANVCPIILNGSDWYASIGTKTSKGTKVFALAGKINNVGLVEIPMGTTIREIVFNIGGGIRGGKEYKAVQTGGPSGGCLPSQFLDVPIDYETLKEAGSMMGSGGMIVLDEADCMVNIAKFYLQFTVDESCGKCTPCRVGNTRMLEILERITQGLGSQEDLDELQDLGEIICDASLCGLGQTAPNPVLSTLRYFRDEYDAHVNEKRCPSGSCKNLTRYVIITEKCVGCTLCARNCPVSCISGTAKKPHEIDQNRCVKCGVCFSKCRFGAIEKK